MMQPELSITIVTVLHNSSHLVHEFVKSVLSDRGDVHEIVAVDSGSSDWRIAEEACRRHSIRFVHLDDNVGYGRASNVGAQIAESKWIAFVNPDVEVTGLALSQVVDQAIANGFSCAAPSVYSKSGNRLKAHGSLISPPWNRIGPIAQSRGEVVRVGTVSGCCMVLSRSDFLDLDGFDEDYFMFCEEVDLHRRMYDRGMTVGVVENVRVTTEGGMSSAGVSTRWGATEREVGHALYMRKNYGRITFMADVINSSVRIFRLRAYRPRSASIRQYAAGILKIVVRGVV